MGHYDTPSCKIVVIVRTVPLPETVAKERMRYLKSVRMEPSEESTELAS